MRYGLVLMWPKCTVTPVFFECSKSRQSITVIATVIPLDVTTIIIIIITMSSML